MDDKTYLKKEIASCKRKQNIRHLLSDGITGMAAGATVALLLEGISVFVPFYYVHVWHLSVSEWAFLQAVSGHFTDEVPCKRRLLRWMRLGLKSGY